MFLAIIIKTVAVIAIVVLIIIGIVAAAFPTGPRKSIKGFGLFLPFSLAAGAIIWKVFLR